MAIKRRLTLEEHRETGKMLLEQYQQLFDTLQKYDDRLGNDQDGRNARKQLKKMQEANLDLRFYLDSIASQEYPKEYSTEVYFGAEQPKVFEMVL